MYLKIFMKTGRIIVFTGATDYPELFCSNQWIWGLEDTRPQSQVSRPKEETGTIAQALMNISYWIVNEPDTYHPTLIRGSLE